MHNGLKAHVTTPAQITKLNCVFIRLDEMNLDNRTNMNDLGNQQGKCLIKAKFQSELLSCSRR
jgi:hypothetical protein